jgi:hypothetical protein
VSVAESVQWTLSNRRHAEIQAQVIARRLLG